ncbi:IclR family transcriptional regulator [Vibrio sp. ZSDZ65]|uniref:IclR family transcriptional regulator n=1 Tax=Vibrio qingdaonensis TaxID=2829491 RepID=A0A9X3CP20_9VIBR|nr:IclR family transcriptional regulator [Vibrio qingdaonensis]MCW8347057.1 IclR family transcriptional regulator [Vibrio qingdaonensis]
MATSNSATSHSSKSSSEKAHSVNATKGSTLERVLQVVAVVAKSRGQLNRESIAEQLSMPIASANKLINQLISLGHLQENIIGRVIAGPNLQSLSHDILKNQRFSEQRTSVLQDLSDRIGETCGISVPNGIEMVYFERVNCNWPLQINLAEGSLAPIAASASGKLYLSSLDSTIRENVVQHMGLTEYTPKTITHEGLFLEELARISEQGFGEDNEEFVDGMVAISVPIGSDELSFGYLFCHAPSFRTSLEKLKTYRPELQSAAKEILDFTLEELKRGQA